jgi:HlyD family secretion protein
MSPSLRRFLPAVAIGLIVIAALAWSFWPRPVPVDVASVSTGPMEVTVSDEGRTRVREIYQLSAPVNGRLLRIEVHAGDAVIAGKSAVGELLPIAPSFLDVRTRTQAEAAVKSAEAARALAVAELNRAKAELAFAASDLKRATLLEKSEAISTANVERSHLAYNTASAQYQTAKAALQAKEYDLDAARALTIEPSEAGSRFMQKGIPLIAPVSGRVLRVLHESESTLAAGTPIMEIGNPGWLEVVAELISEDAVKVHEGDAAIITDWGGTGELHARVRRVEPSGFTKISALGVEEQRVNVLLDFTDPAERWRKIADGYRVTVRIVVWRSPEVLCVPTTAMFRHGNGWAVFAAREGRAVLTPISIGHSNDEVAEVLKGLRYGDRIIVHPSDRVANGSAVKVRAATGQ